jgi:hypothetical protein
VKINKILDHLDKVRKNGDGWIACCPSHNDKTPSMSVCEGDDGRVLLHCFAGCSTESIVAALGLSFADLFPDSRSLMKSKLPPNVSRREVADQFEHELWVLLQAIGDKKNRIDPRDSDRGLLAARRIKKALEVLYGI